MKVLELKADEKKKKTSKVVSEIKIKDDMNHCTSEKYTILRLKTLDKVLREIQ